jgi:predicted lysophospholipase L1 biosynthesis ABC-type transport system permease subunit
VSHELARQLWPGMPALGRVLSVEGQTYEVVGIVADYAHRTLMPMPPRFFLPLAAATPTEMQFVVRANGQPGLLIEALRKEVTALATGNIVSNAIPLQQIVQIGSQEILATAVPLAPLVIIAMILSAAGIYGVLAFTVARRSTEMAVRVAVGADRSHLIRLVAWQSLRVVAVGLLFGVGGTFALTRLAQGGGGIFDSPGWSAFVVPMAIVALIGAVATWLPARRAVRTDPARLLRST